MAKISSFKQDLTKESEGVWFDFESGIRVLIASTNSPKFKKFLKALTKPHIQAIRSNTASVDLQTALFKKAGSKYLVLDWENIEDDDGNPIECTPENCLEIFNDPALREFYNFVVQSAGSAEAFRVEFEAESAGN